MGISKAEAREWELVNEIKTVCDDLRRKGVNLSKLHIVEKDKKKPRNTWQAKW